MTLITPERAAELLALLPEEGSDTLTPGWDTPHGYIPACWPVLAASTDALRTVQHLHGLLDALSKEYDDLRLRHANLSQHNHEIHGKLAHMAKKDGSPALKSLVMNMKATPKSEVLGQVPSAASVLKAIGGITVQERES